LLAQLRIVDDGAALRGTGTGRFRPSRARGFLPHWRGFDEVLEKERREVFVSLGIVLGVAQGQQFSGPGRGQLEEKVLFVVARATG
jgi:hypothetical protein